MKKRIGVQLELEVDKYCEMQAKLLGISKSGFINVAIAQYRQQNIMIEQLPDMLKRLNDIQINTDKKDK